MRFFLLRPLAALLTFAVSLSLTWLWGSDWRTQPQTTKCFDCFPVDLVNGLGQALAVWSQGQGRIILLDGEAVNYVRHFAWVHTSTREKPGCGLPDAVYKIGWDAVGVRTHPLTEEWEVLLGRVCTGKCDEQHLLSLIEQLSTPEKAARVTPEMLANELQCLGAVRFEPVKGPGLPRLPSRVGHFSYGP